MILGAGIIMEVQEVSVQSLLSETSHLIGRHSAVQLRPLAWEDQHQLVTMQGHYPVSNN